ncbi:MAG TPA: PrsW family intramembrane metalloprotease [Candidatus Cloacimonetes bacterium]|nr:PrsW family intramembrane metalloprotease [Candidatus Cloacimonadota bacterium]
MHYLLLGFAPGLYWLWYFYQRDKIEPEPLRLVLISYFLGILAVAITFLVQLPFRWSYFTSAVIAAPIIEESSKFLIVFIFLYRNKNFSEPMDGIVYTSAVALGFASIENGIYLFKFSKQAKFLLPNIILIRALLSVPAHALFSSIWGHALGNIKFSKKKNIISVVFALLLAMILHAFFNFFCNPYIVSSFGLLALLAAMWIFINCKIRRSLDESPYAKRSYFSRWRRKKG